jgi:hypothetical protein
VRRHFLLLVLTSVFASNAALASLPGDYVRHSSTPDNFPERFTIHRFSGIEVKGLECEKENAGSFELKTNLGNITISGNIFSPNALKVSCPGKKPVYILEVDKKYLSQPASDGDVAVWFGEMADRSGCEGYLACDKVHVLQTYTTEENIQQRNSKTTNESW